MGTNELAFWLAHRKYERKRYRNPLRFVCAHRCTMAFFSSPGQTYHLGDQLRPRHHFITQYSALSSRSNRRSVSCASQAKSQRGQVEIPGLPKRIGSPCQRSSDDGVHLLRGNFASLQTPSMVHKVNRSRIRTILPSAFVHPPSGSKPLTSLSFWPRPCRTPRQFLTRVSIEETRCTYLLARVGANCDRI